MLEKMQIYYLLLLFSIFSGEVLSAWNNLNCPAPRSPENGLSFIFRNGELVHFRCHPGYYMIGKTLAYCANNEWSDPVPECHPLKTGQHQQENNPGRFTMHDDSNFYNHHGRHQTPKNEVEDIVETRRERNGKLFNWNKRRNNQTGAYGDGPRRLPLINGIWPSTPLPVVALGPPITPGPAELVRKEVDIAELRHKQFQEVVRQRMNSPEQNSVSKKKRKGKKRKNKKPHKSAILNGVIDDITPRETVISLGTTEDGDALSIAFAKASNDSSTFAHTNGNRHKYRHRDNHKKKRKGKGKKWRQYQPYSSNIIARASRVDTSGSAPYPVRYYGSQNRYSPQNEVAELRRRPVELIKTHNDSENNTLSAFDTSCVESLYGREVPMIAPQVSNAFVYQYQTKKNRRFPYNTYMQVRYRCLNSYTFLDPKSQVLFCREGHWIGDLPQCISNTP